MNMRRGLFLGFGLVSALALLGESTTMAQGQPTGGSNPSPPASGVQPVPPPPAPAPAPAPVYQYPPPPAPAYQPAPAPVIQPQGYRPPSYQPPGYQLPGYQPPGYQQHDGFYLRLHCGGGYLTTSESYQGDSLTVSGGAFAFSAAFGGAVTPNLIIYGEFVGMVVSDPKVTMNGQSATASGTTMTMVGFGPGLAYYIEPVNLYFSGTLTLSKLSFDDTNSGATAESEMGFGLSAALGKEWWVAADWGLGAAFQFQVASMKDKGIDARLTGLGVALLFSATYN